jgi:hypothetical protein
MRQPVGLHGIARETLTLGPERLEVKFLAAEVVGVRIVPEHTNSSSNIWRQTRIIRIKQMDGRHESQFRDVGREIKIPVKQSGIRIVAIICGDSSLGKFKSCRYPGCKGIRHSNPESEFDSLKGVDLLPEVSLVI